MRTITLGFAGLAKRRIRMKHNQRIDTINLHIYLGKKQGANVSYLEELRAQRYLKTWDLYL